MSATWSDARVEVLKQLWREGQSASQIARRLGDGVTRNAVIGKVHRLGLPGHVTLRPPARAGAPQPRSSRVRTPPRAPGRVRPAGLPAIPLPDGGLATVAAVGPRQCRWPMGEPRSDGFRFCGRTVARGAYCVAHGAVAYRPAPRNHLLALAGLF